MFGCDFSKSNTNPSQRVAIHFKAQSSLRGSVSSSVQALTCGTEKEGERRVQAGPWGVYPVAFSLSKPRLVDNVVLFSLESKEDRQAHRGCNPCPKDRQIGRIPLLQPLDDTLARDELL